MEARRLFITRERDYLVDRSSEETVSELEDKFDTYYFPLMNFQYSRIDFNEIHESLPSDVNTPWILVTSSGSLPALEGADRDRFRFAAIGTSTAEKMKESGYVPDFVSSVSDSESFGTEFYEKILHDSPDTPVILLQGNTAGEYLKNFLMDKCYPLLRFESYKVNKKEMSHSEQKVFSECLRYAVEYKKKHDSSCFAVFLSGLQGRYFLEEVQAVSTIYPDLPDIEEITGALHVYSIGRKTTVYLREIGYSGICTSSTRNIRNLLTLLLKG
jgi:uroporphyrinogen-III synthase